MPEIHIYVQGCLADLTDGLTSRTRHLISVAIELTPDLINMVIDGLREIENWTPILTPDHVEVTLHAPLIGDGCHNVPDMKIEFKPSSHNGKRQARQNLLLKHLDHRVQRWMSEHQPDLHPDVLVEFKDAAGATQEPDGKRRTWSASE